MPFSALVEGGFLRIFVNLCNVFGSVKFLVKEWFVLRILEKMCGNVKLVSKKAGFTNNNYYLCCVALMFIAIF